jgi:mannose/cellobiose epimerase-like protein (N-acyl-D-glucosamine 2-epimerase family)
MATAQRAAPSRKGALRAHIDPEWFRKALADETEHWLKAADTPNGFFRPSLDRQWQPVGEQTANLTSQGRHIFMRALGYDLTRNPAYLESLRKGTDFLLANFRDRQYGGLFFSVSPEGKVVDDRKDSYGTAFAIFGLSHAARVTRDQGYRKAALETWAEMKKNLRDQAGFYKLGTTRDYSQVRGTNSQNPMMHLFEALLALHDTTGSKEVFSDAEAHGNAMFTKLFQERGGYLPEFYDAEWKPLPASQRGHPDLGHQFEWAFLWSHAVEKGFTKSYLRFGERLLDYGMKVAYDVENGGIFSVGDYEGNPVKGLKGLWQQCEFLRALMHYAVVRNHKELWEPFDKSLELFKRNFMDSEYGGCFTSYYDPSKPSARLGKIGGDSYHLHGMYSEALRLSGVMG